MQSGGNSTGVSLRSDSQASVRSRSQASPLARPLSCCLVDSTDRLSRAVNSICINVTGQASFYRQSSPLTACRDRLKDWDMHMQQRNPRASPPP